MRCESLEEAHAYLERCERRWAYTRIHVTTRRQVEEIYAEAKPYLQALPVEPFRYDQRGERTVHLDADVDVGCLLPGAAYGRR